MNNLKTYFVASPEKKRAAEHRAVTEEAAANTTQQHSASQLPAVTVTLDGALENGQAPPQSEEPAAHVCVVKSRRPDSKVILQNMEDVLNSVKKKHRQKHRRKREQKRMAQLEEEAVAVALKVMEAEEQQAAAMATAKSTHKEQRTAGKIKKHPLREQTEQTTLNGHAKKSPLKAASTNSSILNHFQRTPKKDEEGGGEASAVELSASKEATATAATKLAKTTNAFELLMNARNKSIGSNTPGKDAPEEEQPEQVSGVAAASVKRKLVLQEWAEKKGGAKRKRDEDNRAAYVEQQLENRAKRLKKMLTSSPQDAETAKTNENSRRKSSKKSVTCVKAEKPAKASRGRARALRLTSVDSVESLDNINMIAPTASQDSDTVEFLAKLSSPTKKRDSLLGYFAKMPSPQEAAAQKVDETVLPIAVTAFVAVAAVATPETPKRVRRKNLVDAALNSPAPESAADISNTPSGRPRRSCAGKTRYECEESPVKSNVKATPAGKATKLPPKLSIAAAAVEDDVEIIIDLDDSSTTSQTPQTPNRKLAPLFMRSMPKPSPDPAALRARQAFLMSGVPEKLRLEQAKQKQYEQQHEEAFELFPKVSHVLQRDDAELQLLSTLHNMQLSVALKPLAALEFKSPPPSRRSKGSKTRGNLTACSVKDFRALARPTHIKSLAFALQAPMLPSLENKRAIIKLWKTDFSRFPTYKCYNQLREKYRYFSAIDSAQATEQVTESFVVTRRTRRSLEAQKKFDPDAEEAKPPPTAPNGELLFSEKYKPLLFEQVLVNLNPVTQLRDFLANWTAGASSRNSQSAAVVDETFDLANDSNSSQFAGAACNTVVLLGPGSSGKTNAVFALANEMNFNVLEINAGMRRTGKKLIQELQEATQSHQIRKEASSKALGKGQKTLLKMSLNGLKSKAKQQSAAQLSSSSSQSLDADTADAEQNSRKCLILIEDADIVFDQTDAGFTDAIYTLAASSKRPVIVVASNPNCAHLQRLMHQNTIQFASPNVLNISKFLAVLSLIENCPINLDDLVSLYLYNGRDLRKTLLELQFFVQSGGDGKRSAIAAATTKQQQQSTAAGGGFYASPSKRRFSEEPSASLVSENEEAISKEQQVALPATDKVYMHRRLFDFYTMSQNEKHRIPFPLDFQLLRCNLVDVFQVSAKLQPARSGDATINSKSSTPATKRKSRSPKKVWLNSATAAATAAQDTPLDSLCAFYENASVAALLGTRAGDACTLQAADRLVPHMEEHMAHTLVEGAIALNLEAGECAYNLFDTPNERHCLLDQLGHMVVRTQRTRALDFEPALRTICRSEKFRSSLERRSTRFYHYLRNSSVNLFSFSTEPFDKACDILWDDVTTGGVDGTATAAAATLT